MAPRFKKIKIPEDGQRITLKKGKLHFPNNPIIPVIEGDGIGRDIMKATRRVLDAAVEKAYKGKKRIVWMDVYAGENAFKLYKEWLPEKPSKRFSIILSP